MYQNDLYLYIVRETLEIKYRDNLFFIIYHFSAGRIRHLVRFELHRFSSWAPNSRALLINKYFSFFLEATWISQILENLRISIPS